MIEIGMKEVGRFNVDWQQDLIYDDDKKYKMLIIQVFDENNKFIKQKCFYFRYEPHQNKKNGELFVLPSLNTERIIRWYFNHRNYTKFRCIEFTNIQGFKETEVKVLDY